jgi:hypothetical protein
MKIKRTFLTFIIALVMVVSISSVKNTTLAYWSSGFESDPIETVEVGISIGSWLDEVDIEWVQNENYVRGDIVTYFGRTYEATRNSRGIAPRSVWYWWFFWVDIT